MISALLLFFSQLSDLMMCYETHHIHVVIAFLLFITPLGNTPGLSVNNSWISWNGFSHRKYGNWTSQTSCNHIKELTKDHIKGKYVGQEQGGEWSSPVLLFHLLLLFLSRTIRHIKMSQEKEGSYSRGRNLYQCCAVVTLWVLYAWQHYPLPHSTSLIIHAQRLWNCTS